MKKSILTGLSQLCLIVFSVVLGLYLSERIEDKKNAKEAEKLLLKIKSELNENKLILDEWVPYHIKVTKNLDSLSNDDKFIEEFIENKSTLYNVFTKNSIMSELPSSDAWEIAKSHPLIVNFEYDALLILSKLYNQQKSSFENVTKLVELLLSPEINDRATAQKNLQLLKNILGDISNREIQLLNYYNEAEKILNFQNK